MKNFHPLAWASMAATVILTVWAQYGPMVLPHLSANVAQIVTAVIALIAAISPNKK